MMGGGYELDLRQNAKTQCGRCKKTKQNFKQALKNTKGENFNASSWKISQWVGLPNQKNPYFFAPSN